MVVPVLIPSSSVKKLLSQKPLLFFLCDYAKIFLEQNTVSVVFSFAFFHWLGDVEHAFNYKLAICTTFSSVNHPFIPVTLGFTEL